MKAPPSFDEIVSIAKTFGVSLRTVMISICQRHKLFKDWSCGFLLHEAVQSGSHMEFRLNHCMLPFGINRFKGVIAEETQIKRAFETQRPIKDWILLTPENEVGRVVYAAITPIKKRKGTGNRIVTILYFKGRPTPKNNRKSQDGPLLSLLSKKIVN
jgi:hypothetical protein